MFKVLRFLVWTCIFISFGLALAQYNSDYNYRVQYISPNSNYSNYPSYTNPTTPTLSQQMGNDGNYTNLTALSTYATDLRPYNATSNSTTSNYQAINTASNFELVKNSTIHIGSSVYAMLLDVGQGGCASGVYCAQMYTYARVQLSYQGASTIVYIYDRPGQPQSFSVGGATVTFNGFSLANR